MAFLGRQWLLLSTFSVLGGLSATPCEYERIECKTKGSCIKMSDVCNGRADCGDGSDEDPTLCKVRFPFAKKLARFYLELCNSRRSECLYNFCENSFNNYCSYCADLVDPKAYLLLTASDFTHLLPAEDSVDLLKTAVNATLTSKSECPMLYERIGNHCLAFFSLSKVPWPEARQFCKSIFGDLVTLNNVQNFMQVIQHLKTSLLTTDFWIGGRYDMDVNSWAWVAEETPMPLGSPYWGEKYISPCVPRSPPHTDPFSDPPSPLPGAPCYHYVQSPQQRQQGWCSAMTYEHHYYITDEECQHFYSPLCVLTHMPHE
ncbi:uncharacterized protein LOC134767008 [Penaeus indicus]|uniref:uncharacterized protein LOC134767008 n=1 Tax=Penaeus indicus TaxID=29960 RepID=UPI00300D6725